MSLIGALAAEEAAIYAYGVLGVHLTADSELAQARAAEATHRARRDVLVSRLAELNASAAPAPAGYELPFAVTNRATALELAVRIEDGVAQAWRAALGESTGADRSTGISALTDAAVRATRWRRIAKLTPLTMPWPGRAG
jgi:hypothetical protein